uniref:ELAV-like protein 1-B n=1 Tax=Styela clava TaxID=7725 RepID=UPI00193A5993|nr:ELAV-like protein 1-B [Styela clava]
MTEEAESINKTNLIINYLPQCLSDEEFYSLFTTIGPVYSARIIRERSTGYSYGYGFVKYQNPDHAATAIEQLNGFTLLNKQIKVAYSLPSGHDNKNINVYVKGLPANTTNDTMRELFKSYGEIIECRAIPDKITGLCQGIGFVLFSKKEQAENAISALNGTKVEGGAEPLLVKFAKNDQKNQKLAPQGPRNGGNNFAGGNYASGFGGNNYTGGYGSYGNYANYGSSNYGATNYVGWENSMSMMRAGGMMQGGGPIRGGIGARGRNMNRYSPMTGPRFGFNGQQQPQLGQTAGAASPDGFIVFVYGIGPHMNEDMLWQMCSPFGDVKRVNVIRDHSKNQGKGYGFVTFGTLQEASYCINQLNGSPYEGKQLQVSLKTQKPN